MKYPFSLISLLLLCFVLTLPSCQKDIATTQTSQKSQAITIAEARTHFEERYGGTLPTTYGIRLARVDTNGEKEPMWDGALLQTLRSGDLAVLVPLHKPGAYVQVTKSKMAKFGFLNYLMMRKDSTG